MQISGIKVEKYLQNNIVLCIIEHLSQDFKEIIKNNLSVICYGRQIQDEGLLDFYPYEKTLECFWERYKDKTEETQKGMIGELLAHVLTNLYLTNLETISIYFNKEELSIRKGFDILYYDLELDCIRYAEVKSGSIHKNSTAISTNNTLLYNAEQDLVEKLKMGSTAIWDNAKIDARLVYNNSKKKTVLSILTNDQSNNRATTSNKRAILLSTLFHNVSETITDVGIKRFHNNHIQRCNFHETIIFSIQKNTYEAVATFLKEEKEKCSN